MLTGRTRKGSDGDRPTRASDAGEGSGAKVLAGTRRLATTSVAGILRQALPVLAMLVVLVLAANAGEIPVPGTPVGITLQTLVVMLSALLIGPGECAALMASYLVLGAAGFPVFAGGGSTASLVGPSAGFLYGFLPAAVITSWMSRRPAWTVGRGARTTSGWMMQVGLRVLWYSLCCVVGCIAVEYLCGILVQSVMTGVPASVVATASLAFVPGDLLKALAAAAVVAVPGARLHLEGSTYTGFPSETR